MFIGPTVDDYGVFKVIQNHSSPVRFLKFETFMGADLGIVRGSGKDVEVISMRAQADIGSGESDEDVKARLLVKLAKLVADRITSDYWASTEEAKSAN